MITNSVAHNLFAKLRRELRTNLSKVSLSSMDVNTQKFCEATSRTPCIDRSADLPWQKILVPEMSGVNESLHLHLVYQGASNGKFGNDSENALLRRHLAILVRNRGV